MLEDRTQPSFAAPVSYNLGTNADSFIPNAAPTSVATADFNGDGKLDLVVTHRADNSVYVLLNNGAGGFQPAVQVLIGEAFQGDVFVGDFNNDGKLDLFLPGNSNQAIVLLGNGNGTFQPHTDSSSFAFSGYYPRGWTFGDFNGDGKLDVASTLPSNSSDSGRYIVLLGNGNGTFQPGIVGPAILHYSRWATTADFNHDGKLDLAIADGQGKGSTTGTAELTILFGNGDGTFSLGGHYASPGLPTSDTLNPEDVKVADVNGDGKLDAIISNYDDNINVFLGNGDGTFQPAIGISPGEYPRSVNVVDVNGDGKVDLVVTDVGINTGGAEFATEGPKPGSVAVLLGNGNGTFQAPIQYTPFQYPGCTAVGDFNGDGRPDLAVTRVADGHSVNVMQNVPDGIPAGVPIIATGADAGGGPHVKVFNAKTNALLLEFFAYDPTFTGGVRVAVGDVNGDGIPDIITGAGPGGGPHVKVFSGKDGSLLESFFAYAPTFTGGVFVAAGDVNGDGLSDIITGAGAGGGPHVKVFSGKDGSLLQSFFAYSATFRGGVTVASGDVDGNGHPDIITGAGPGGGPHVKAFDGMTLVPLASFFAYDASFAGGVSVAAGDINGDGKAEIVTAPGQGIASDIRVFNGTSGAQISHVPAFGSTFLGGVRVAITDFNGDGRADIIASTGPGNGPQVRVFDGPSLSVLDDFLAYDSHFMGGVFVGGM
jgi:hypothetical protein